MNRKTFHAELNDLQQLLLTLGERVEIAISKSILSLTNMNRGQAEEVIVKDVEIDRIEEQIDNMVTKLIATQQPVAKDLRRIVTAITIASDMERMADLAQNIAEITVLFVEKDLQLFKPLEDLPRMARISQEMVHDGINSFIDGNIVLAKQMAQKDDEVDQLYNDIVRELIDYMVKQRELIEPATQLAFVTRHLERIADHATNIAESVIYIETGKREDLN